MLAWRHVQNIVLHRSRNHQTIDCSLPTSYVWSDVERVAHSKLLSHLFARELHLISTVLDMLPVQRTTSHVGQDLLWQTSQPLKMLVHFDIGHYTECDSRHNGLHLAHVTNDHTLESSVEQSEEGTTLLCVFHWRAKLCGLGSPRAFSTPY